MYNKNKNENNGNDNNDNDTQWDRVAFAQVTPGLDGKTFNNITCDKCGKKATVPTNAPNGATPAILMTMTIKKPQLKTTLHKQDPPNKEQDTFKSPDGIYSMASSRLQILLTFLN